MRKTLSVCIVLFNRWVLSKQTIESINNTVPKDWDILWSVIDNGSIDETAQEIEPLLKKCRGQIEFLQLLKEPIRQTQAVNRTMNPATGEYILRVDNDIKFTQGWFEDCHSILNDSVLKDVGFVCMTHHLRQANKAYQPILKNGNNGVVIDLVSERNYNVPGNILIKKSVARDIGGFYTPYNLLHADVHYCAIARNMGYKFGYTWKTQCDHIGLPDGQTEYSQKAIHERRSEDARCVAISKGDYKDKHPQEIEFVTQLKKLNTNSPKKLPYIDGINVLITSCGRRVELVNLFKNIFDIPRFKGSVITCGLDHAMPASFFSHKHYVTPAIYEDGYIDSIIEICKKEKIRYIFPTIDHDLSILSKNKTRILREGYAEVVTPDAEFAEEALDKIRTYVMFKEIGLRTPKTYLELIKNDSEDTQKYIIKPIKGFGSKNIIFQELPRKEEFLIANERLMAQDFIKGEEFTADVVSDRQFGIVSIVFRKRESVRGGEIQQAEIVNHLHLFSEIEKISKRLHLFGPWCVQYIVEETTKDVYYIEVNTRFGGGVPISARAGQDHTLISIKVLERDFPFYHNRYLVEWGLTAMRFDDCVYKYLDKKGNHDVDGKRRFGI
jgi:carbamoyl-phosphate synthase large subunit